MPPNILFILSDQHHPGFLGCAGEPLVRTPHLDALAARGTRFGDCSCGNPLCVPSRMTLLTARHGSDIGVWTNGCPLGSNVATFVHHLALAGYETVLCGRMHFVGADQRHGYQRRILGDVDPYFGVVPRETCGQAADGVRPAGPGRTSYQAYDQAVTEAARRFLERWDEQAGDRPFFLTVGTVLPHCPYICPKRLYDEYAPRVDVPALPPGYLDRLHPALRAWRERRGVDTLTDAEIHRARSAYYGLVALFDEQVGALLDTLGRTRYADDTIVVYASDHGDMAGEHRMFWKSSFYQGSVGVPLIVSHPGRLAEGRVVDTPVSLLDLGPTLVDLANGAPMAAVRGRALTPFLRPGPVPEDAGPVPVFAEYAGLQGDLPGRMVRRGPWKLNHYHGYDRPQLFNLADDPGEWHDRAEDSACREVREELEALALDGWSGETIERALAARRADGQVLRAFAQQAPPPGDDAPDQWRARRDCEQFPEL